MERVAFLVERTNQRLGCLLNPEQLVIRRTAGIHPRQGATGVLTGAGLSDDPLIFTGGGRTELELSLLFDVSLAGSSVVSADIRDLTAPLWQLAENPEPDAEGRPPLVRFIWGKAWNIPGVIVAEPARTAAEERVAADARRRVQVAEILGPGLAHAVPQIERLCSFATNHETSEIEAVGFNYRSFRWNWHNYSPAGCEADDVPKRLRAIAAVLEAARANGIKFE